MHVRVLLSAAVVVALATTAWPAAGAVQSRKGCAARGADVVAQDRQGRLDWRRVRGVETLYGCVNARGVRRILEEESVYTTVSSPLLASPFAAYVLNESSTGGSGSDAALVDLRTGRSRYSRTADASDLRLHRRGVAVYVARSESTAAPHVEALTLGGTVRLSEVPPDAGSLAVSTDGRRAYWTVGGAAQSAPLPDPPR